MNLEEMPEKPYDKANEHPTPEELFVREAAKYLTPKQRVIWEYWNYDKLTQDKIAVKCGISQVMVLKHIRAIEKRIEKWCQENFWVYNIIKDQMEKE